MGFSKKAKHFFYIEKGLNNKEISEKMDGYSPSMISRYLNTDVISHTFIQKIIKYFPEADIKHLIQEEEQENMVLEPTESYANAKQIISEIEDRLQKLKELL
jgi:hypothetical protein